MSFQKPPQIVLLGDSLIESASFMRDGFSFTASLEEHCSRRLDVINRGLSGYTTKTILAIFDDLMPPGDHARVDYLLILLGANDFCLPSGPYRHHVPLATYSQNIKTIIEHPIVQAHQPTILLVTPPPINELQLLPATHRVASVIAQYASAIRSIAAEYDQVVLVDLYKAIMNEAIHLTPSYDGREGSPMLGSQAWGPCRALETMLVDGLHLTGKGYEIFARLVRNQIGREWDNEPFETPSWIFPHWRKALELAESAPTLWNGGG